MSETDTKAEPPKVEKPKTPLEALRAALAKVDVKTLKALEQATHDAFVAHGVFVASLRQDHPDHADHLSLGDLARRRLGAANGALSTALQSLEEFAHFHEKTRALHAANEQARLAKLEQEKKEGKKP